MKKFLLFPILFLFAFSLQAQLNVEYQSNIDYDDTLSDIWGYVSPDNSEYALVGMANGVSIVDVTDPVNPVELFFITGVNSGWRDIKTWGEYAYVINESGNGLSVIDLSDLPNSVDDWNWNPNIEGLGTLSTCHNIWIDEFGYAYLVGCNLNSGGMIYVDVFTNPGMPEFVAAGPSVYAHDLYVRGNKAYSCEINNGVFSIYDVSDKENTILEGSQTTGFQFTHNAWLSDDSNILFTTDELGNAPVGSYDVSDPSDIQELDQFVPYETLGDGVIPHNVHVFNDFLIISYYTDGCIIVDGSNPDNLVEVGNFDTFIPDGTGFAGAWGAYPFLPSGTILVSDMGGGLFVLAPTYVNACWLEGNITNAETSDPIDGATIVLQGTNVVDSSNLTGEYATGFATAGTYTVEVSKPGFEPATAEAVLVNGEITLLDVELVPLVPFAITGLVQEQGTGNPISFAKVLIQNEGFEYDLETDDNGAFSISSFYAGDYEVYGGLWGYKTFADENMTVDELNPSILIELEEGYEDIFSLDLGWVKTGFVLQGGWARGVPNGIDQGGFELTPLEDRPEDAGNHCWVTGNTNSLFEGVLAGGTTTLTSPVFDATSFSDPFVSYYWWHWNINPDGNNEPGDDPFVVSITNGLETVALDSVLFASIYDIGWEYSEHNLNDFIDLTTNMQIIVEASATGYFDFVTEAALDYFQVTEGSPTGLDEAIANDIIMQAYPNPSQGDFNIQYNLKSANEGILEVRNASGQSIETFELNGKRGLINLGASYSSGMYFVTIRSNNQHVNTLKLIKE